MTAYAAEAGAELRKARDANEARAAEAETNQLPAHREKIMAEVNDRRMEIASVLTALAAIDAGLPPGCCRCTTAEGTGTP